MTSMRHARGQAATELALFGIVLVPLILYTMFLHDLLRFKLDLIEAVTSTPWDYTTLDYENAIDVNGPAQFNKQSWWDHTTAYNSFDKGKEGGDLRHHESLSAHACWLVQGAQQIRCKLDNKDKYAEGFEGKLAKDADEGVNRGGRIWCSASLGVINYFLPQKIFTSFTNQQTTSKSEMHGKSNDVHAFGKASNAEDEWVLEMQRFGLITDTWAMTTVESVDNNGGEDQLLYKRTDMSWDSSKADKAKKLGDDLKDDEILNDMATSDTGHDMKLGDDPTTIQVGWTTDAPPLVDDNYSSAWVNKPESTYGKRGGHYMGAEKAPK